LKKKTLVLVHSGPKPDPQSPQNLHVRKQRFFNWKMLPSYLYHSDCNWVNYFSFFHSDNKKMYSKML
jgi:hypothetical protein